MAAGQLISAGGLVMRWRHRASARSCGPERLCRTPSAFQNNGVNVAAVVGLFAVHRTTVAEEARVGIGVDTDIVDDEDAGIFQPAADEAGKIEHGVSLAGGGHEEQRVFGIRFDKS